MVYNHTFKSYNHDHKSQLYIYSVPLPLGHVRSNREAIRAGAHRYMRVHLSCVQTGASVVRIWEVILYLLRRLDIHVYARISNNLSGSSRIPKVGKICRQWLHNFAHVFQRCGWHVTREKAHAQSTMHDKTARCRPCSAGEVAVCCRLETLWRPTHSPSRGICDLLVKIYATRCLLRTYLKVKVTL